MGWGDAWAGLSQQAFGFAIDSARGMQQDKMQRERDQIAMKAEEAQRKQREAYEERMLEKRAALDRAGRQEDFKMRKGLAQQEQSFRAQESAADRAIREQQLRQNEAYNQGQLGLQSRGLDLRAQEMEIMANRPQGGASRPLSEADVMRDLNAQFNAITAQDSGLTQAQKNMAARFMSDPDASPTEKAEALRRLRAQALVKPDVIPGNR